MSTRRRCRGECGGNKIIYRQPNAATLFPKLAIPDKAWVRCVDCKASGFQEGERDPETKGWTWRPAPQEHIVL